MIAILNSQDNFINIAESFDVMNQAFLLFFMESYQGFNEQNYYVMKVMIISLSIFEVCIVVVFISVLLAQKKRMKSSINAMKHLLILIPLAL